MRKQEGVFQQYLPNLTIDNLKIPALDIGTSFKYLGKFFSFEMDNAEIKSDLVFRLSNFLRIINNLNIKAKIEVELSRNVTSQNNNNNNNNNNNKKT